MSNLPGNSKSGVLIRVVNLDAERIFYRDLLRLGEPVIDSGFWVEFLTPDGTRLLLEKSAAPYLEHEASATTVVIATPDLEAIRRDLENNNYNITPELKVHPGEAFYRAQDPEGNVFYLCCEPLSQTTPKE